MPEEDRTKQTRIALMVYAVVRLHRAHMNNQQRRADAMTDDSVIDGVARAIEGDHFIEHMPGVGEHLAISEEASLFLARAAFAVFEKAHLQTVIERHDLVMPIYDEPEPQSGHFHIWSDMPCKPGECRMEPQGEPSDAQVTAALVAWEGQPTRVDAMRAALRAATGVSNG